MSAREPGRTETIVVVGLLLVFLTQAIASAVQKSLTMDEYTHFGAAVSYVENNYYRLNPNHPPFCKVVTGLAVLTLDPKVPPEPPEGGRFTQRLYGIRFTRQNAADIERITFVGRLPHIVIALLLGVGIWLSARCLYGRVAGLTALVLWATDPNLLAHARLVHTDSGAAVFVFLCLAWLMFGVLRKPTWTRCVLFSLLFGLALLTKFSTIVLVMIAPLQVWLFWYGEKRGWITSPGPEGVAKRGGDYWGISLKLLVTCAVTTLVLGLILYRGHLEWWFHGLSRVLAHNETGHEAYILGHWFAEGKWYYFIVALAVKTPLPLLILALVGAVATLRALRGGRAYMPFIFILPGLIWLGFAMTSKINIGMRHVLPAYAFMFILAGAAVKALPRRRWWTALIVALICWQGINAIRTYPDYIPYFNEAAGGPGAGIRYFADSDVDWGQELLAFRRFMEERDTRRGAAYGLATPAPDIYGIPVIGQLAPPTREDPVYLALGARDYAEIMFKETEEYTVSREFLKRQERVAHLGNALFVFRVTEPFPTPFP